MITVGANTQIRKKSERLKRRQAFFELREPRSGQATEERQTRLLPLCWVTDSPDGRRRARCRLTAAYSAVTSASSTSASASVGSEKPGNTHPCVTDTHLLALSFSGSTILLSPFCSAAWTWTNKTLARVTSVPGGGGGWMCVSLCRSRTAVCKCFLQQSTTQIQKKGAVDLYNHADDSQSSSCVIPFIEHSRKCEVIYSDRKQRSGWRGGMSWGEGCEGAGMSSGGRWRGSLSDRGDGVAGACVHPGHQTAHEA